jgi:hypothetical protein
MFSQVWQYIPVFPAVWEVEAGELWLEASLGKVSESLSQKQAGCDGMPVIPASQEVEVGG